MSGVVDLAAFRRGRALLCASEVERCVPCWARNDPPRLARAVTACEECGAGLCTACFQAGPCCPPASEDAPDLPAHWVTRPAPHAEAHDPAGLAKRKPRRYRLPPREGA